MPVALAILVGAGKSGARGRSRRQEVPSLVHPGDGYVQVSTAPPSVQHLMWITVATQEGDVTGLAWH